MKTLILTIALCAAALCARADLFGLKYNTFTTNATGGELLTVTNSTATLLTPGLTNSVAATGFLSVSVVVTNSQIVWLTNLSSHVCVPMGNIVGTWTNWDNAQILCTAGDIVLVTNISGSGGATLVGSQLQVLH